MLEYLKAYLTIERGCKLIREYLLIFRNVDESLGKEMNCRILCQLLCRSKT